MSMVIFLFKQKTAYEMRISDWSSDVCSSDLGAIADPDRKVANFRYRAKAAGYPQRNAFARGFEKSGGNHRILGFERLLHLRQRYAERGQLDVAQLDPDFLVLQADQIDLGHIRAPLPFNQLGRASCGERGCQDV